MIFGNYIKLKLLNINKIIDKWISQNNNSLLNLNTNLDSITEKTQSEIAAKFYS